MAPSRGVRRDYKRKISLDAILSQAIEGGVGQRREDLASRRSGNETDLNSIRKENPGS